MTMRERGAGGGGRGGQRRDTVSGGRVARSSQVSESEKRFDFLFELHYISLVIGQKPDLWKTLAKHKPIIIPITQAELIMFAIILI